MFDSLLSLRKTIIPSSGLYNCRNRGTQTQSRALLPIPFAGGVLLSSSPPFSSTCPKQRNCREQYNKANLQCQVFHNARLEKRFDIQTNFCYHGCEQTFAFVSTLVSCTYNIGRVRHLSLLVVGSLALDSIETPFGKAADALGGSAVYISTAASYFVAPVRLVGIVGGDFPKKHIDFLEGREVDLEGLQVVEGGKTFRWGGRYHYDLNVRDTLFTELNVFEHFKPVVPEGFRKSTYVCLGNIDPTLQADVLGQLERPRLVVGDTMNFWIERKAKELRETLKLMDVLVINDSETRLLSGEPNLIRGAKKIMAMGPKAVIIKKGEHGAVLVTENTVFTAPAYPMENINDPTGAGDSFAGGFIGWLAKTDDLSEENYKRAVIYGSALASFCVEQFSIDRLRDLSTFEIKDRVREFRELSRFDEEILAARQIS